MKTYIIILLSVLSSSLSVAQNNYLFGGWNYQVPLSNREWLDTGTGYGGMAGYRFMVKESQLSVGLDVNWATFKQYEPKETFPLKPEPGSTLTGGSLTTDYFKFIYQYGATISAQYYFNGGKSDLFFPYVGLGLGANYNAYTLYYNIYEEKSTGYGFLARPEAGFVVRFGERRSIGAMAAIHYDYSTNRNQEYGYTGFSSTGVRIGLIMMNRY